MDKKVENDIHRFLNKYAGIKWKKNRPTSNTEKIEKHLRDNELNKDEYLTTFKGILQQGVADRCVYDAGISIFAMIIGVLSFFSNQPPVGWIALGVAVVAFFLWFFAQLWTQYYAEMYEVISGLEKEGFFKKDGEKEEKGVTK